MSNEDNINMEQEDDINLDSVNAYECFERVNPTILGRALIAGELKYCTQKKCIACKERADFKLCDDAWQECCKCGATQHNAVVCAKEDCSVVLSTASDFGNMMKPENIRKMSRVFCSVSCHDSYFID
jgi:hypothetical protein